jgi:hypothetical protein
VVREGLSEMSPRISDLRVMSEAARPRCGGTILRHMAAQLLGEDKGGQCGCSMEKGRRRGEVGLRTVGHVLQGLCHGQDIRFPVAELGRPKKMAIPLFSVSKQPLSDHWEAAGASE